MKLQEERLDVLVETFKKEQNQKIDIEIKKALEGKKNKQQEGEFKALSMGKHQRSNGLRLKENRKKFFQEVNATHRAIELLKYSDYAHDLVSTDLLGYLLLRGCSPHEKELFLYNKNMGGSLSLQKLVNDIEKEMENIQNEKQKIVKNEKNTKEIQAQSLQQFKRMVKKSRFAHVLNQSAKENGLIVDDRSFNISQKYMRKNSSINVSNRKRMGKIENDEMDEDVQSNDSVTLVESKLKNDYRDISILRDMMDKIYSHKDMSITKRKELVSRVMDELMYRQQDIMKCMNNIESKDER